FSIEFLQDYSYRMWKDFGKKYDRFYRIKQAVDNLTDDELNGIADKVLLVSENKRTLRSVFQAAVYKKPSLVVDVLKVFAGV
ncbi:MAG: hypothetical protein QF864_13085, partial [SAR202 cluster bacterium]|nr:hypothetical protein [SAR202 cluster bacterium]